MVDDDIKSGKKNKLEFSMVYSTGVMIESVETGFKNSGSYHLQVVILIKINLFENKLHDGTPYNNVRNFCKRILFK